MQDNRFDNYDHDTQNAVLSFETMRQGRGNIFLSSHQLLDIISFYLDNSNVEGAREALNYGHNIYPNDVELAVEESRVMIAEGEAEQAIPYLQTLIQQRPTHSELYFLLGNAYEDLLRWEEAQKAYEQVLQMEPDDSSTHALLAITLMKQDKTEEALEHSKRLFQNIGENFFDDDFPKEFFHTTSRIFSLLQKDREAISFFENIVFQNPLIAEGWHVLAIHKMAVYEESGDMEILREATEAMNHCVAIAPENTEYHSLLAGLYADLGEYDTADEILQDACTHFPDNGDLFFQRGRFFQFLKRIEAAVQCYHQAKSKGCNNGLLWSGLAYCYAILNKDKAALHSINCAIEKFADDKDVFIDCANAALLLKMENLADLIYDKGIETFPNEPQMYNYKASALLDGGNYEEAVKTLETVLENGNADSITDVLLCDALYRKKDMTRLFFYMEEGLKASPFFLHLLQEYCPDITEDDKVLLFIRSIDEKTIQQQKPYKSF